MCLWGEPKTKYYYHEEIIPARRSTRHHDHDHHHGHGHGHHHHHHHHHHSPRASYTSVTRRSPYGTPRSSAYLGPSAPGAVVYERTTETRR